MVMGNSALAFAHYDSEFSLEYWIQTMLMASGDAALAIGIGLTVAGSCLMAVGSVVMKHGIHQESKRLQRDISMPLSSYLWWIGISTYSAGAFLHIIGLAFAPASILAPLNSLGLVANAAAAVVFLQEKLSLLEIICTLGAIIGVTLCAVSSFLPHDESSVVDGIESWTDPLYLTYISICGVSLIICLILINNAEARIADERWEATFRKHLEAGHIELPDYAGGTITSFAGHENGDDTAGDRAALLRPQMAFNVSHSPMNGTNVDTTGHSTLQQFLYPGHIGVFYSVVAGIVGAQCVLQLKEFSVFLKLAVDNVGIWCTIQPYLAGIFGIVSIVLQMHFLNLALARGDATLVIPTYYVFWTIFGTLGGFVKFHEIFGFTALQICLFFLGLLATLISIALMASLDIKRVQSDVERSAPLRTRIEPEQRLAETPLTLGVPLAVGLGIIPIGRLAGRFRAVPTGPKSILRRTQSFADFPPTYSDSLTGRTAAAVEAGRQPSIWIPGRGLRAPVAPPYSWTVTGNAAPFSTPPGIAPGSRVTDQYCPIGKSQGYIGSSEADGLGFRPPDSGDQYFNRGKDQGNAPQWGARRPGKKYKRVIDIMFEEEPVHECAFYPEDNHLTSSIERMRLPNQKSWVEFIKNVASQAV